MEAVLKFHMILHWDPHSVWFLHYWGERKYHFFLNSEDFHAKDNIKLI